MPEMFVNYNEELIQGKYTLTMTKPFDYTDPQRKYSRVHDMLDEIKEWVKENLKENCYLKVTGNMLEKSYTLNLRFRNSNDRLLFKLTWA
jgi:alpha-L-arabinofuranosidase